MPRCQHRKRPVQPSAFLRLLPKNHVCPTQSMTSMTPLGPTALNARDAKRRFWQATRRYARIVARPPQWVCRVRCASASSEGFVSLVTAFALGPPRLHDPTGSLCLALPKAGLNPRVGPLAPVASPVLHITAPDNDASAAAEPLVNTLLSYSPCGWEQAAPSRRQLFTNLSV